LIGGRSGAASIDDPERSISRKEVEHAFAKGIQLFVFVERSVCDEYETYLKNVDRAEAIQ